eukprot:1382393-Rhodomonas_salina.1
MNRVSAALNEGFAGPNGVCTAINGGKYIIYGGRCAKNGGRLATNGASAAVNGGKRADLDVARQEILHHLYHRTRAQYRIRELSTAYASSVPHTRAQYRAARSTIRIQYDTSHSTVRQLSTAHRIARA